MVKNKLHQSFKLCLILIGSLLFFSIIPEFTFGPWKFKQVDLLSDIRKKPGDSLLVAVRDSITVKQDSIAKVVEEHCKPGITCIEDYSADSSALKYFFESLEQTKKSGKRLRIAFYGDSFIEGDVFCGGFRDTLQSIYGGRGVGYVPITSTVTGFRNTIKHRFDNWSTSSIISKKDTTLALGPAGYCFVPLEGNWVEYRPSKQRFLREFNTVRFYYTNMHEAAVLYTLNDDSTFFAEELKASPTLQEWSYQHPTISSVKFEFYPYDGLYLYGACFEHIDGVYVDNFSLRGNTGLSLTGINDGILRTFGRYRDYKLIILQFGLNLVVEESLNYSGYAKRMIQVVNKMKKAFPKSSFLLLSVSDRSTKVNGKFQTMAAVPAMRNAQRTIAMESKIAFWDMYQAMGGENSMVAFAQARPPLAAKDYTHLTFQGGKKLAGALVRSLLFEQEKYAKRKKQ